MNLDRTNCLLLLSGVLIMLVSVIIVIINDKQPEQAQIANDAPIGEVRVDGTGGLLKVEYVEYDNL